MLHSKLAPLFAVAATLTSSLIAQGDITPIVRGVRPHSRTPGSVLVFPVHRSGPEWFTVLNVTNTATLPDGPLTFGGSTNAHFEYVNVTANPNTANPLNKFLPVGCTIFDRVEFLTPADHAQRPDDLPQRHRSPAARKATSSSRPKTRNFPMGGTRGITTA